MHDVTLLYRRDVERNMRTSFGSCIFDILTLEDVCGRGRWLRMLAEERDL
jgi:head-tail adaptor